MLAVGPSTVISESPFANTRVDVCISNRRPTTLLNLNNCRACQLARKLSRDTTYNHAGMPARLYHTDQRAASTSRPVELDTLCWCPNAQQLATG